MSNLVHYTYANSSAAYRVRIALNLKGLKAEERYVHLLKDGGQHHAAGYAALNPQEVVPTLVDDGQAIGQSLAIIEYLDEVHPEPALLPRDPLGRARVRQIALAVACDIHPVNNLRVRQYLKNDLALDDAASTTWMKHWIDLGFAGIEPLLDPVGPYACGATVTLADIFLVPQVFNARRFAFPLDAYPRLVRADAAARALSAFADAAPEKQPDFGA
ncbi:Maleylpyruvate isomerase [Alphaproteobacteria bacterium SO-S41]|nr:Maleylpyruvate isomerase [Alphaproteobacteria bacterium SO-S41]